MVAKCVLTIQELNWNQRLRDKKTKLNICHHVLTSSSQLQNRSFHVVERMRTSAECPKMKNARAKPANLMFFTLKYANFLTFLLRRRRGCTNSLMNRRGGKREGAGRKKSPALAKITREVNQKYWRANQQYIYFENRVFSTWRKVRAEGTFANDSNFASWLLGLELRRRREQ